MLKPYREFEASGPKELKGWISSCARVDLSGFKFINFPSVTVNHFDLK